MKANEILNLVLHQICSLTLVLVLLFITHDKVVELGMVKIYENYISEQDSIMKSVGKNPLSVRGTHKELLRDSVVAQMDSTTLKLYILKPQLQPDSTMKGALYEIYWGKVPRQKVPFLEELIKKK